MSIKKALLSAIAFAVIALQAPSHSAFSQEPSRTAKQKEFMEMSMKVSVITRINYDPKLSDELELTPDQKKRVLIALQKYQDEARKLRQPTPGKKPDISSYQKQMQTITKTIEDTLSEGQSKKLSEMAKRLTKRPTTTPSMSAEAMQEMQKHSSMMRELSRLSYDQKLAQELEITAEQKVEIREAQQSYQVALRESMKARQEGKVFDLDSHAEMTRNLMMKAQEILTPEQTEKLARSARLKTLKRKFGDEFAMINGLAEDFGLDEKQTVELREKIAEARQDYYAGIKKLKEDTMSDIIGELPKEHRKEVEDAVSEFLNEDPMKKQNPFATPFRVGG